jgi:hypothetical protein
MRRITAVAYPLALAAVAFWMAGATVAAETTPFDAPQAVPPCPIHASLPGLYISFQAAGQVNGTTFAFASADSYWAESRWIAERPIATPVPAGRPIASYVYYGTYALKRHRAKGCAYLSTHVGGEPYPTTTFNASTVGVERFGATATVRAKPLFEGRMKGSVTGLSTAGGSGVLTLTAKNGLTFDTATVVFTGRVRAQ